MSTFSIIVFVGGAGYLTAIVQKFTILKLKDNVELSISRILLEASIVVVTVLFGIMFISTERNTMITDVCSQVMQFNA